MKSDEDRKSERVAVNVHMPQELVDKIDEVARRNGRDRSKEIRFVMTQHVLQHASAVSP